MASVFVALPHSQVRSIRHQDRRGCVWWSAWLLKHLLPSSFARNLEPDAETRRCLKILEFHSICASCFWIQVSLDAETPKLVFRGGVEVRKILWRAHKSDIHRDLQIYSSLQPYNGSGRYTDELWKLRKWIKNLESGASIGHEPSF